MHHVFAGSDSAPRLCRRAVGVPRAFGMGHSSRPLRGNFCSASKLSAALWSKTAARCFAFSSGHTSTVDSVPSGAIRTTCHPMALASYRSRFILRICAPCRPFARSEVGHNQLRRPLLLRVKCRLLRLRPLDQFLDAIKKRSDRSFWPRCGGNARSSCRSQRTAHT